MTRLGAASTFVGGGPADALRGPSDRPLADRADYPPPALGWYVVGTLFIAWVLAYLDRQILTLLVPLLKADLALSDIEVSLVQGVAFSLFFSLAGLPIGRLVDRGNRRNIIVAGILLWSIATMLCGAATSFGQLFMARVGVGIGEACLAPAAFSIVADCFPPARRGRAMGIMAAGVPVGTAASLFVGGLLIDWLTRSGPPPLPLLAGFAPRQIIFLLVGAPGLLVAALVLTIAEPDRLGARTDAAAPDASFGAYMKRNRGIFSLVYAAFACNLIAGYSNAVWGPVVFMRLHGMSAGMTGMLVGAIMLVVGGLSSPLAGWLSDRLLARHPLNGRLKLAPWLLAAGIPLALLYPVDDWRGTLIAYAGLVLTINLVQASAYPALQDMVPNRFRGQVIAVALLISNVAGLGLAPIAVAFMTDIVFADEMMLPASIAAVIVPALLVGVLCSWLAQTRYAELRRHVRDGEH